MTQSLAISLIEQAPTPAALFLGGPPPETVYRNLAKLCHPDIVTEVPKDRAEKAFKKLGAFYAEITGKTVTNFPVLAGYAIERALAKGDICDVYVCSSDKYSRAVLKIAQLPRDNDLVTAEASALKLLHADSNSDNFKKYIPILIKTFKASGRQVNVVSMASTHMALGDICGAHPNGLDFRHLVWMGNRLWSALGFAHRNGLVYGCVIPEHLLYQPVSHQLVLIDWCYSVKIGEKIPAIVKLHEKDYPPEVARKLRATPATDIYMAAHAIKQATDKIPKRFLGLFDHCLAASPSARPQDAWELQDKWEELAKAEYGPAKYLELKVPVH